MRRYGCRRGKFSKICLFERLVCEAVRPARAPLTAGALEVDSFPTLCAGFLGPALKTMPKNQRRRMVKLQYLGHVRRNFRWQIAQNVTLRRTVTLLLPRCIGEQD